MKLILLKNIKKLGNSGNIIEVKSGYAMNFLIPQKIAVLATPKKIKELEKENQKIQKKKIQLTDNLENIIKKINNKKIKILKQASEKGKLFASISQDEILLAVKNNFKVDLSNYKIKIKEHLKKIGEHKLNLKIKDKKINLIIEVCKK